MEFQTVGPKTEKDLLPKVSRQKRGTESRQVSRARSVGMDEEDQKGKVAWYLSERH